MKITKENIKHAVCFIDEWLDNNWDNFGMAGADLLDIWQLKLNESDKQATLLNPLFGNKIAENCKDEDHFLYLNEVFECAKHAFIESENKNKMRDLIIKLPSYYCG